MNSVLFLILFLIIIVYIFYQIQYVDIQKKKPVYKHNHFKNIKKYRHNSHINRNKNTHKPNKHRNKYIKVKPLMPLVRPGIKK